MLAQTIVKKNITFLLKADAMGLSTRFHFAEIFMGLIIAQIRKVGDRYLEICPRLNGVHSNLYNLKLLLVAPRQVDFHLPSWDKKLA